MGATFEDKKFATKTLSALGLHPNLRARALVLVAGDSALGSSLRTLLQLNADDHALKALVYEFFKLEDGGKVSKYKPLYIWTHPLQSYRQCQIAQLTLLHCKFLKAASGSIMLV